MSEIKELSRTTVCTLFKIRAPIWNGGKRMVGLDMRRISKHNEIWFTYVRKSDGELSMPDKYYFDGDLLKEIDFTEQAIQGTYLAIIPFEHIKRLERI
jgi:hypothetical protein